MECYTTALNTQLSAAYDRYSSGGHKGKASNVANGIVSSSSWIVSLIKSTLVVLFPLLKYTSKVEKIHVIFITSIIHKACPISTTRKAACFLASLPTGKRKLLFSSIYVCVGIFRLKTVIFNCEKCLFGWMWIEVGLFTYFQYKNWNLQRAFLKTEIVISAKDFLFTFTGLVILSIKEDNR